MNLRRLREAKGLTQQDLADMIGATKSKVSRAEAMHPSAMLATYAECAQALGCTLGDIFSDNLSPVERSLLDAYRSTPDEQRGIWHELLKLAKAPDPQQEQ